MEGSIFTSSYSLHVNCRFSCLFLLFKIELPEVAMHSISTTVRWLKF